MGRLIEWIKGIVYTCPECSGSGLNFDVDIEAKEIPCPSCGGRGFVTIGVSLEHSHPVPGIEISEENIKKAVVGDKDFALVEGKATEEARSIQGRLVSEHWQREVICPTCAGRGMISRKKALKDEAFVCRNCLGTGKKIRKGRLGVLLFGVFMTFLLPELVFVLIAIWNFGFGLSVAWKKRKGDKKDGLQ